MRLAGLLLALALVAASLACARAVAPDQIQQRLAALGRPNVVFILVDTLRADYTTPYGFPKDTTPELERWARRGALFERCRSQSSWTKMSMASIMTSLWPHDDGIREARDGLGPNALTLAEVLQQAGYATYAVQTNGWLHQSFGFQQGFDRYVFPKGGGDPRLGVPSLWANADRVYEEAAHVLETLDRHRPFFLYLHFMDVHEYASPPEFKVYGTDDRGAYLAAIRWVDDTVQRIREKLAAEGYLDHTVIVFDADHGEELGEHGIHGHARNVLMPVVGVPLVIRLPFRVAPAIRVHTQVRNLDVAPTILALAGVPIPGSFEGRSLLPLMMGKGDAADRISFAALGVPLFPDSSVQASVTDGRWMYARNATAPPGKPHAYEAHAVAPGAEFLFDQSVDPGDNVNLLKLEPAEARRMRALLDRHLAERRRGVVERGVRIDPEIAKRLRAMGYLR